jgi:hypothetical protein
MPNVNPPNAQPSSPAVLIKPPTRPMSAGVGSTIRSRSAGCSTSE